jgi:hypothetical protein
MTPLLCEAASAIANVARSRQASRRRAGGGRADRAEDARGVPPLEVMMAGVPPGELAPHLVAGGVGPEHVTARGVEGLAFGQDRRDQHGARVPAERDIVVIERVRSRSVDPRGPGAGPRSDEKYSAASPGPPVARVFFRICTAGSGLPPIIVPTQSTNPVRAVRRAASGSCSKVSSDTKRPSACVRGSDRGSEVCWT